MGFFSGRSHILGFGPSRAELRLPRILTADGLLLWLLASLLACAMGCKPRSAGKRTELLDGDTVARHILSVHRVLTKSKRCHFTATWFYEFQRMLGTARRPPNCVPRRRPKGRPLALSLSLSLSLSRARRSHRPRPSVRPTIVRLVVGGAPLSLERGAAQSRLLGLFCLTAFTSAPKYSVR